MGLNARVEVLVTRDNGFRGPVSLAASGLPAGVTLAGVLTIPPDGNQVGVIFLIGPSPVAGSYPIVIRGTGPDVDARTATFNLVIPVR